jgi:hypothetical protein
VPLWSLMIRLEGNGGFSTQVSAPTPNRAVRLFLEGNSLPQYLASCAGKDWPETFAVEDVIAFIPMDGLTNMHLCQAHRNGKYMDIILVKTESSKPNRAFESGRAKERRAAQRKR